MICKWYHIFNTLPNKWLTFDEVVLSVKERYKTVTNIENALNDMIREGKYIKSKTIHNTIKYRWSL